MVKMGQKGMLGVFQKSWVTPRLPWQDYVTQSRMGL